MLNCNTWETGPELWISPLTKDIHSSPQIPETDQDCRQPVAFIAQGESAESKQAGELQPVLWPKWRPLSLKHPPTLKFVYIKATSCL